MQIVLWFTDVDVSRHDDGGDGHVLRHGPWSDEGLSPVGVDSTPDCILGPCPAVSDSGNVQQYCREVD